MPHPVEAKKSVEIAIDSIEPSETKRAKVSSHKTMSEKKKTDLVITIGDILRQKSADVLKRPRQRLNGRKNLLLLIRKNQGNN